MYKFPYNLMLSTLLASNHQQPRSEKKRVENFRRRRRCRHFAKYFFFYSAVHSFRVAFVSLWRFTLSLLYAILFVLVVEWRAAFSAI